MFSEQSRRVSSNRDKARRRHKARTSRVRKTKATKRSRNLSVAGLSPKQMRKGIQKRAKGEYHVDRQLLEKVLNDAPGVRRSVRMIPRKRHGQYAGLKLYRIRRNSLFDILGFNNGDMVRTINGFDISKPEAALKAFTKLRHANHITVALERRRRPMTIDYYVR
jgi:general secretion pathway protein C